MNNFGWFSYSLITYPISFSFICSLSYFFFVRCPYSSILLSKLGSKLMIGLIRMTGAKTSNNSQSQPRMLNDGQSLEISYLYGNIPYKIIVPFRPRLTKRGQKVKFIPSDPNEVERYITQQSGIPYLITPKDLGGTIVIQDMNNKIVRTFTGTALIECYGSEYSS